VSTAVVSLSYILLLFFRGEPQGTDEAGRFDDESL
jgi:hypothetical protein